MSNPGNNKEGSTMIAKKDLERIAQGFKYVADDPTTHHSTVVKMITEFANAADSLNPNFDRARFSAAIFGGGRAVLNPFTNERITCGACGYDLFYDRGVVSHDTELRVNTRYNWVDSQSARRDSSQLIKHSHECQRCFHITYTITEKENA